MSEELDGEVQRLRERVAELEELVRVLRESCWRRVRQIDRDPCGPLILLLLVLLSGCERPHSYGTASIAIFTGAAALPESTQFYAPAEYDPYGAITGACFDPACAPRFSQWPDGVTNLVAVHTHRWYPNKAVGFGTWTPTTLYTQRFNLRGTSAAGIQAGDVLTGSGWALNDAQVYGVGAAPPDTAALVVVSAGFTATCVRDSILTVRADVVTRVRTELDTSVTFYTLVQQGFSR